MSPQERPIFLIINADDFNLTEGVSRGILEAHDAGVVTSTSLLINFPILPSTLRELRKRKDLGIGLHLNITLGNPLGSREKIPSLVGPQGLFHRRSELRWDAISRQELAVEYKLQIERFRKIFKKSPTHLDTHHHLHEKPAVFEVLADTALRYRLPIRRSSLSDGRMGKRWRNRGLVSTDFLWEDLDPRSAWNQRALVETIRKMKPGYHELMCHPARSDRQLMKISSFNQTREQELKALLSHEIRLEIQRRKIRMVSFRDLG